MKKILLLLILSNSILFAQVGIIKGVVKQVSGKPVELVNISIPGTFLGSVTNSNGEYVIPNIPLGNYSLEFTHLGFEKRQVKFEVKSTDTIIIPDVFLKEKAKELDEIIVEDNRSKFGNIESDYIARLPVKNLENPQSYSTTTPELLTQQNIVDYSSAVQTIPGGVVASQDPAGNLGLYVRGFLTRTYIRNGLYTFSHNSGDLQTTERLEIIKGPSSLIYGTSGISYGGLINRVTKKPFEEKYIDAGMTFGSYNLQRFTGDINLPLNDDKSLLFRLNAAVHSEGSFQDFGYKRNYLIAPGFYYKLSDKVDFLFDAELNSLEFFTPSWFLGAASLNISSIEELKVDYFKTYFTNVQNEPSQLNNYFSQLNYYFYKNWKLSTNVTLGDLNLTGTNMVPRFLNDSLMIRRLFDYNGQYNSINIQPFVTGEFFIGDFRNRLVAGVDYKWAQAHVSRFYNLNVDTINYTRNAVPLIDLNNARINYNLSLIEKATSSSIAVYFSEFFSLTEKINLMFGLRFEQLSYDGQNNLVTGAVVIKPYKQDALSPQAGISYEIIENQLSVFTNYMKGFNFVPPNNQGQSFKPELGEQFEGGVKLELFSGNFSSTVSYYNISLKDKIRPDVNNLPYSIQDGTQLSRGIDIDLRISPIANLDIIAGYGFNESELTKAAADIEGKRPLGAPKHIATFWGSYTFSGELFGGFGIGAGFTYSDDYFYNDQNTLVIPGYILYKGSLFYNISKFRITITAENITDKKHWDYIGTPQMPRRILASINFKFE